MRDICLSRNLQVLFWPDKTIKAFVFQNKNQIKIQHTEDMLFILHVFKTFLRKRLKENSEAAKIWAYGGKTQEMSITFLVYYHIAFYKEKKEKGTYLVISCDDKKLIPRNKDLLDVVASSEDETNIENYSEDTALHYACNFSLMLSEFTVGYYTEVLSRLRYFT